MDHEDLDVVGVVTRLVENVRDDLCHPSAST